MNAGDFNEENVFTVKCRESYDDIKNAYDNGKLIIGMTPNGIIPLYYYDEWDGYFEFKGIDFYIDIETDIVLYSNSEVQAETKPAKIYNINGYVGSVGHDIELIVDDLDNIAFPITGTYQCQSTFEEIISDLQEGYRQFDVLLRVSCDLPIERIINLSYYNDTITGEIVSADQDVWPFGGSLITLTPTDIGDVSGTFEINEME